MRFFLIFLLSITYFFGGAQITFGEKQKQTMLAKLLPNDSVVY